MTRILLLLLVALICAPAAFGQGRYEFYVGYAYERANNNADRFDNNATATFNGARVDFVSKKVRYNGFDAEFDQNVTRHIGIVTQLSGVYNTTGYFDRLSGRTFRARVQRYDLLAGPRYNWRPEGVTPFVHALFGFSHMRARFDNLTSDQNKTDTAFAMAFGGGLDVHASQHIDVRAIQVDYLPVWFNGRRQDNFRATTGVKLKFGKDP